MEKLTVLECAVLSALIDCRIQFLKDNMYFKAFNLLSIKDLEELKNKIQSIDCIDLDSINFDI